MEPINVLAGATIYGCKSQCTNVFTPEQTDFIQYLDMDKPAEVFNGNYEPCCRLFLKGYSSSQFMILTMDKRSSVRPGQCFNVRKCFITEWEKPGVAGKKYRVWAKEDSLV